MIEALEVISRTGVVSANPAPAARIGARILEAGGNAMDAAVAASMACCMLRPNQTGIGGYVCDAVVRDGKTGRIWSMDANGIAPAAAHERMYQPYTWDGNFANANINEWEYACSVVDNANVFGPLSVTVPGMMAGMGITHERWGKLPWAQIVAPSLELLEQGFPYEEVAVAASRLEHVIRRFPATAAHLLPDGKVPCPDDIWHRPDMEKTLARVAEAGWRDFYEGDLGRAIADAVQAAGGIITREDMAAYQPRITDPYTVDYHGSAVHCAILPNGGLSSLQALNMLECLDLPAEDSPFYWHLLTETFKHVWRDRIRYVTDPDFAEVPIRRLLSKDYAAGRVEAVSRFPMHVDRLTPEPVPDTVNGTLHVSTADAEGNLVSITISQGYAFGSCFTVPGTGIILGHGMARFDPRPGLVNSVAPRKRPLNNTAAMIVESPDRDIAIGMPGGRAIISVMSRAVQLIVDRGYTGHQAAIAPRLHVEETEPVWCLTSIGENVTAELQAMGHEIDRRTVVGGVINSAEIMRESGDIRGGSGASAAAAD